MPLIDRHSIIANSYAPWNGEGAPPSGNLLVAAQTAFNRPEIFVGRRVGVVLANTADPLTLLPIVRKLSLIALAFPVFRDGRAFTQAAILREAGFTGELRATGRVLIDQIPFMARVGFTSFEVEDGISPADIAASLLRYRSFYQNAPGDRALATPLHALNIEAAA